MVPLKSFLINFLLGGAIVSVASLIGSQGRGLLAAFVATFPTMTVLTFSMIYRTSGYTPTVNYAKGLLLMTPPWIVYVLCLIFLLPRCGFVKALTIGIVTYSPIHKICNIRWNITDKRVYWTLWSQQNIQHTMFVLEPSKLFSHANEK